ncbi:MAG: DsbA family oxidoreductase [Halieaceae bacterium]|nr:DsbA family oxidoreductase [Halieaceae bacterium]MCP5147446.1 DsbA family oxidoreductase [Pseudomonadales bacterium]MCP5166095.1 DsbA family oxidoreductase [Pseudomonadales bacterium]MCP5187222.1 DsbA family oxidoreductase [Pseudomonadales bacterium]
MQSAEPHQPPPLRIDIVSDVVCPWCIIGYRQLQRALAQLPGVFAVQIHWQPFELNPHMPPEGQELREHLAQKYGTSPQQSQAARQRLTELGDSLGFHFDYYDGMRIYNTFSAHQLLHWAGEQGRQTELKLALFEAFFSRRENVGDSELLAAVAGRVGLDSDEARRVLAGGVYAQAVRTEQARWLEREVHAVPMFFLNDSYGIPGAQEPTTFLRVLEKLRSRASG